MINRVVGTQSRQRILLELLGALLVAAFLGTLLAAPAPAIQAAEGTGEGERASISLPALPTGPTLLSSGAEAAALLASGAGGALGDPSSTLAAWDDPMDHDAHEHGSAPAGDGQIRVGRLVPSPDGRRVALQMHFGTSSAAMVLDARDRTRPTLTRLTAWGVGHFLGWHPDNERVLYRVLDQGVADSGLWLVHTSDGSHVRIPLPHEDVAERLMAAAISPDGRTIAYSVTRGLGFGSAIWLCDSDGGNQREVWRDETVVVGSLKWAPDGSRLAFTTLIDSPVPFAEAGLWVMDARGEGARWLARMDGGHGQQPVWSHDGQRLYVVARENYDDVRANHEAAALVSSIRSVDVESGEETTLVPADSARQIDLSLAADGSLLFASTRATGTLELWSYRPDGTLQQLTSDGVAKRHPLLLP